MTRGAAGPPRPSGWVGSPACRVAVLALFTSATPGCGGGAPLFHPAHVLRPGKVSAGAGVSGQLALVPQSRALHGEPRSAGRLESLTVAPAAAPLPPMDAPAGAYAMDLSHTSVTFRISHLGLSRSAINLLVALEGMVLTAVGAGAGYAASAVDTSAGCTSIYSLPNALSAFTRLDAGGQPECVGPSELVPADVD